MQTEFTYRELSEKLNINLAKLKRWGREFLPLDAMAGQSQGVARRLNIDDAFCLLIAGELVGNLKFPIPISKKILEGIMPWLIEKKFMPSLFKGINTLWWDLDVRYDQASYTDFFFIGKGLIKFKASETKEEIISTYKVKSFQAQKNFIREEIYINPLMMKREDRWGFEKKELRISMILWKFFVFIDEIDIAMRYHDNALIGKRSDH